MITSEWGTPNMVKDGVNPELLLAGKYGHKLHIWDLDKRRHLQELDLGAEQQMVLELRPAHDPKKTYGFVGVVVSLKDLSASIWMWYREDGQSKNGKWAVRKVIEIPAEPADPEKLPPLLKGFKAVPPLVTDINLSLDDRFLYVSCWGTGEFIQYDVSDPANPKKTGSIHLGGIVRRAAHPKKPAQPLNGGPQMVEISRDGKRVYFTNSLYSPWDEQFYPGRRQELDGEDRRRPQGRDEARREILRRVRWCCARTRCGWKAATPRRTPTATRTRNDARRAGFDGVVADAAPRRLPRTQPRDGLAVRGGAGDAGAKGERSGAKALVPIALGHALAIGSRRAGCRATRHGAAAGSHPLLRRRDPDRPGNLLPGAALAPALGPYAGRLPRPDGLVVSDGLGARRRFDGGAGAAGQQHGRSGGRNGRRATIISCRRQPARRDAGHRRPYVCLSRSHRADRLGGLSQIRPRPSPQGMVQLRLALGSGAGGYGSCEPL